MDSGERQVNPPWQTSPSQWSASHCPSSRGYRDTYLGGTYHPGGTLNSDSLLWGDVKNLHTLENKVALSILDSREKESERKFNNGHCYIPVIMSTAKYWQCLLGATGNHRSVLTPHESGENPEQGSTPSFFSGKEILWADGTSNTNGKCIGM